MISIPRIKSTYILVAFFLGTFVICSCTYTCVDFHEGKFKYENSENDPNAIITRVGNKHIEQSDSLGYKDIYKIFWTDDCSYKLVLESTNNPARMPLGEKDTIFVQITSVDKKGYTYDALILGQKPSGRIIKIKD